MSAAPQQIGDRADSAFDLGVPKSAANPQPHFERQPGRTTTTAPRAAQTFASNRSPLQSRAPALRIGEQNKCYAERHKIPSS